MEEVLTRLNSEFFRGVRGSILPVILSFLLGLTGISSAMPVTTGADIPGRFEEGEAQYSIEEGAALESVEIVLLVMIGLLGGLLGLQAGKGVIKTSVDLPVARDGAQQHVLDL
jgi:hypothetical protein